MPYAYGDPNRETDPHALPNIEIWRDVVVSVDCDNCGLTETSGNYAFSCSTVHCPSCEESGATTETLDLQGWFFRWGFPGCMPDSDEFGPYETEDSALDEARDQGGYYDD